MIKYHIFRSIKVLLSGIEKVLLKDDFVLKKYFGPEVFCENFIFETNKKFQIRGVHVHMVIVSGIWCRRNSVRENIGKTFVADCNVNRKTYERDKHDPVCCLFFEHPIVSVWSVDSTNLHRS